LFLVTLENLFYLDVDDTRLKVVLDEIERYCDRTFSVGRRLRDVYHRRDHPLAQCRKRRTEIHPVKDEIVSFSKLIDQR
jgi:hypothetical protein